MKKYIKYVIILVWVILILLLKEMNIINLDFDSIKKFLENNSGYAIAAFSALWVIRLLLFIPGVTLMILGGICFGWMNGALFSLLGIILSEIVLFIIARRVANTKLKDLIDGKYPEIAPLIEKHNYRFLALGIICPIAPTDAVCFMSSSMGIGFLKYILTVITANIPVIALYSFVGLGYKYSIYSIAFVILTISLTTFYTVKVWYGYKKTINVM